MCFGNSFILNIIILKNVILFLTGTGIFAFHHSRFTSLLYGTVDSPNCAPNSGHLSTSVYLPIAVDPL